MDTSRSLQIVTNLAVLLGIFLLVFELNQAKNLTRAQLYDASYDAAVSRNLALLGDSAAESLAAAIFDPQDLTKVDAVILNQFYNSLLISWYRTKDEKGLGYFGEAYQSVVASEAYLLNSLPGRAWWDSVRNTIDPEVRNIVDEALAQFNPDDMRQSVERVWQSGKQMTEKNAR